VNTPPYSSERVQINAEVDTEDRDRLRESAKANDRSFAAELRRAIRFYLEHGE
jgi:hypothetical protein